MSTAGQRDDVVVVGGGPAGAVTALVLARKGARVRLFERARVPRPKLCGDTLNPGALAALGPLVDVAALRTLGCALHGMRLSGPGGAALEGRYPAGVTGLGITRATLDAWLLAQAVQAGAVVDDGVNVLGPVTSEGAVTGVRLATAAGARVHEARIVVAADGRHSRLASALGLLRTPVHPRRWALGAYAHEVGGVHAGFGEMHVRRGYYLGLAPMDHGLTNVCLVLPRAAARDAVADPWAAIQRAAAADPSLGPRLRTARLASTPVVLGPMAVDASAAGAPGLLLAGDAAGFVDPMTGDGLRLAIDGAVLAASVAAEALSGVCASNDAPGRLAARRRHAFAAKWRFNRSLRALVDHPEALQLAAWAARAWTAPFAAMIRYAGDVRRAA